MNMKEQTKNYINELNLDVRRIGSARLMDQKCTPDVVCAVAECILEYTSEDESLRFTKDDIWHSDYANELIQESFTKPDLSEESVNSEYDKFFAQPMKLLAYCGILDETQDGANYYTINHRDLLRYISSHERNAIDFLEIYLSKVMEDSGMMNYFDDFFEKQDRASLYTLRDRLMTFYHNYTRIKNNLEPPRIFNKIINILAFKRKKKGTVRGTVSTNTLTIEEIRYNRINWRDVKKDKTMSRQEYNQLVENEIDKNTGYYKYQIEKAKRFVKDIEKVSEIHRFENYPGSQAHHIFMASEFPEIADCPENIICITPNQHFYRAHPDNHTQYIDLDYQIVCLLCKLDSIEINFRSGKCDYSLADFINVLNIGLGTDVFNAQMDFEEVKFGIIKHAYYHESLGAR